MVHIVPRRLRGKTAFRSCSQAEPGNKEIWADQNKKGRGCPRPNLSSSMTKLFQIYFKPFALQKALKSCTNFWFSGVLMLW